MKKGIVINPIVGGLYTHLYGLHIEGWDDHSLKKNATFDPGTCGELIDAADC